MTIEDVLKRLDDRCPVGSTTEQKLHCLAQWYADALEKSMQRGKRLHEISRMVEPYQTIE